DVGAIGFQAWYECPRWTLLAIKGWYGDPARKRSFHAMKLMLKLHSHGSSALWVIDRLSNMPNQTKLPTVSSTSSCILILRRVKSAASGPSPAASPSKK